MKSPVYKNKVKHRLVVQNIELVSTFITINSLILNSSYLQRKERGIQYTHSQGDSGTNNWVFMEKTFYLWSNLEMHGQTSLF